MAPRRTESGQVSVLIIGLALVLLLTAALVVDASAAYLQRQGLDNLAEGAALQGADLGSVSLYTEGLPTERLLQSSGAASDAVGEHLASVGAYERYPGLTHDVEVDRVQGRVTVELRAPLDLPLSIPGGPDVAYVTSRASASVTVQRQG